MSIFLYVFSILQGLTIRTARQPGASRSWCRASEKIHPLARQGKPKSQRSKYIIIPKCEGVVADLDTETSSSDIVSPIALTSIN